jgi:hypothetical protein
MWMGDCGVKKKKKKKAQKETQVVEITKKAMNE